MKLPNHEKLFPRSRKSYKPMLNWNFGVNWIPQTPTFGGSRIAKKLQIRLLLPEDLAQTPTKYWLTEQTIAKADKGLTCGLPKLAISALVEL